MAIKIGKKIKGYSVLKPEDKAKPADAGASPIKGPEPNEALELPKAEVIQMHEKVERPEVLIGSTYKIKSPLFEHALYVTINDIVLNKDTEYESRRPFEIFINSKNMDHFQWIVALTRIMSAVFRKGGDVTFLVEEMKAVFDPRGGYFKAGGLYMPSIVAEIGAVVEDHLKMIGMIIDPEMSDATKALIAEKRAAYEAQQAKKKTKPLGAAAADTAAASSGTTTARSAPAAGTTSAASEDAANGVTIAADFAGAGAESARHDEVQISGEATEVFPATASICPKCSTKALVLMDGCATCLSCGYSKCG
jgi:hypothetical protein